MLCPLVRKPPCPREPCESCREDMAERSAILQFAAFKPGTTEPLCSSRGEADALAREQALAAMPGAVGVLF